MTGHFKNINVTVLQKDIHVQFARKTTLESQDTDKHMKTHAPVRNIFTCHWCGCQCLTGKQLDLHIEQKHANLI